MKIYCLLWSVEGESLMKLTFNCPEEGGKLSTSKAWPDE